MRKLFSLSFFFLFLLLFWKPNIALKWIKVVRTSLLDWSCTIGKIVQFKCQRAQSIVSKPWDFFHLLGLDTASFEYPSLLWHFHYPLLTKEIWIFYANLFKIGKYRAGHTIHFQNLVFLKAMFSSRKFTGKMWEKENMKENKNRFNYFIYFLYKVHILLKYISFWLNLNYF